MEGQLVVFVLRIGVNFEVAPQKTKQRVRCAVPDDPREQLSLVNAGVEIHARGAECFEQRHLLVFALEKIHGVSGAPSALRSGKVRAARGEHFHEWRRWWRDWYALPGLNEGTEWMPVLPILPVDVGATLEGLGHGGGVEGFASAKKCPGCDGHGRRLSS
jgi:hypothetical protein